MVLVVGMGVGWDGMGVMGQECSATAVFFLARGCEFTPFAALFSHAKHLHGTQ